MQESVNLTSEIENAMPLTTDELCEADLVNLQLSGDDFDATSLDVLPSLQALTLNLQAAQAVHELLDPRNVPALKILGLENIGLESELQDLESTGIDKILPQLDVLSIEMELYDLAKDTLLSKLVPRMLIDAEVHDILSETEDRFSTIQHLRFNLNHLIHRLGRFEAIRAVNSIFESDQHSKPRQLRSIYLDPDVRPNLSDTEKVNREFAKLEERCREAGIDLVFEVQGHNSELDSFVSREFCCRQRKSRENKQLVQV